jgi:hypothetical protein
MKHGGRETRSRKNTDKELERAFGVWLDMQREQLRERFTRSAKLRHEQRVNVTDVTKDINDYYDKLLLAMNNQEDTAWKEVTDAVEELARAEWKKTARGAVLSEPTEEFKQGFLKRYDREAAKRLCNANRKKLIDAINREGKTEFAEVMEGAFADWDKKDFAGYEQALLLNEVKVALFRSNGFYAEWASSANSCQACQALDGSRVTTLKPPLHKGCDCTVVQGSPIRSEAELAAMKTDTERYAGAAFKNAEYHVVHVKKHKHEVGARDSKEYLNIGRELLQSEEGGDIMVGTKDKRIGKYDKSRNLLAIGENGTIVTVFKPMRGERYFRERYKK